eukprot:792116-Rhodomonas_salina.2
MRTGARTQSCSALPVLFVRQSPIASVLPVLFVRQNPNAFFPGRPIPHVRNLKLEKGENLHRRIPGDVGEEPSLGPPLPPRELINAMLPSCGSSLSRAALTCRAADPTSFSASRAACQLL